MAAAFTTTASALSAPNALSSRGAAALSSGNAFQSTCIVQQGPVTSRAHRMVAARASLGAKESKAAARREVLASILAAGAALGFGSRAVADPIEDAKSKVPDIVSQNGNGGVKIPDSIQNGGGPPETRGLVEKAKDSASKLPEAPSLPDFTLPKPELPKVDLPKLGK